MGSQSTKCKERDSTCHIYYAVKLKNRHQVSVYNSDVINSNLTVENDESDMFITFDYDNMNKFNNSTALPKLNRMGSLKEKSSESVKEVGQFWAAASRESIKDTKRSNFKKLDETQLNWDEQRKRLSMAASKGRLSWTNLQDKKRSVRSTAAQAGSNASIRESCLFKSRSNKGSASSVGSLNHKESFSDSKFRGQNENYNGSFTNLRKKSLKNIEQLENLYENKTFYSSDSLSDCTNKTRDLDLRLKGGGLIESKVKNKSFEKAESRSKINEERKEHDIDESDIDEANLKNEYIDARWQALCTSNDKEQVLVPCPTCGRKFSEEAAYRHFPICSRVKEKVPTAKVPKNIVSRPTCASPSSPSFINVMADETLGLNDKRDDTRKSKPIAFTFTKNGQKCLIQPSAVKPAAKSSEQCKQPDVPASKKNGGVIVSPVNSKKGSGNSLVNKSDYGEKKLKKRKVSAQRSDGVRKSASIWRKSIKEFKTIAETSTKPTKVKESNSSCSNISTTSSKIDLSVKKPISKENRGNGNASCDSRVCPTCGKLSSTSVDKPRFERSKSKSRKCFSGKYKSFNNKVFRSAKDMRDLESIPQNVSLKDSTSMKKRSKIESSIDSFNEKCEPCFYCGRLVRRSVLDSHSFLCERIKNIEVFISKDPKKQLEHFPEDHLDPSVKQGTIYEACDGVEPTRNIMSKQYLLVEEGSESPVGMSQQAIASMKCPCCSQGLALRLVQ